MRGAAHVWVSIPRTSLIVTLPSVSISQAVPLRGPVLALDLGGTHLRTAVVDAAGTVHGRQHNRTEMDTGADAVMAMATSSLRASLADYTGRNSQPPVGIGISAPGPLLPGTGTLVDPPNLPPDFWGLPIGPRIGEELGLPWALERDTHVAILGEHAFGAGRGFSDVVYMTVSTGIGGGIISDGRLVTGPDGAAGELGHLTVDMDGPFCGCGGRGHLERMSSGTGMARSAREALEAGERAPELARITAQLAPHPLEARHVSEAAAAGDPVARRIVEDARRAFASAAVSIVDVFNPQRFIVGGGIALAWGEELLGPARELVAATAFRLQARRVEIVLASLGDDVGLIGALPLVASALAAHRPANDDEARTQTGGIAPVPAQTG
jgi:glucokinase